MVSTRRQSDSDHSDADISIIRASCSLLCFALRSDADIDSENSGLRPRLAWPVIAEED